MDLTNLLLVLIMILFSSFFPSSGIETGIDVTLTGEGILSGFTLPIVMIRLLRFGTFTCKLSGFIAFGSVNLKVDTARSVGDEAS